MIDLSRHPTLLKMYLHLRRLRASLPLRRRSRGYEVEQLRASFYETLWKEAAARAGASVERLGYEILEIRRGATRIRVIDNCSPIDDPVTLKIALNKALVYKLLAREGLAIPRHLEFRLRDMPRAVAFLESAGVPCVVKPADGTAGGNGVTTGIQTGSQLARAAVTAVAYGPDLLLEEQVPGANYRLLYLDGVYLDAVLRQPPAVTGDGCATIHKLVEALNAARLAQGAVLPQLLITIDQDMKHTLANQRYTLRSIPPPGTVVPLKTVINQGIGNDNRRVTDRICDALIADGARAARAVGTRLAGIDVITTNPGVSLAESGGAILEVNATPGYHHHYTRDGTFAVADVVLAKLLGEPRPQEAAPAWRGKHGEEPTIAETAAVVASGVRAENVMA